MAAVQRGWADLGMSWLSMNGSRQYTETGELGVRLPWADVFGDAWLRQESGGGRAGGVGGGVRW
jgi:hypothetical protein